MTLKEEILSLKPTMSQIIMKKCPESKSDRYYNLLLRMCDRLENSIDCSKIYISGYQDIFDALDKYNIFIFDIVPKDQYEKFKKYMLESKVQICPLIGKESDNPFDLSREDDCLKYMEKNGRGQF